MRPLPRTSHVASSPPMTKPFASCTLPDLAYEMFLNARAAAAQLLPLLADAEAAAPPACSRRQRAGVHW
jgi:hypothetical protein